MPYKKKRIDRDQVMITSFDSLVEPESIARIIDFFVDHVDLMEMGFQRAEANAGGRGCYPPSNLMKLYLYGFLFLLPHLHLQFLSVVNIPLCGLLTT